MKMLWLVIIVIVSYLCRTSCFSPTCSAVVRSSIVEFKRCTTLMSSSEGSSKRSKRRSRLKTENTGDQGKQSSSETDLPTANAPGTGSTFERELPLNKKSRLPPIVGSAEYIQAKYQEKSLFEKLSDEYLAPTPQGQEPKSVQLIKTVTWVAVLVLVLIEIFVSIKVGGMPFDTSRASITVTENIGNLTP